MYKDRDYDRGRNHKDRKPPDNRRPRPENRLTVDFWRKIKKVAYSERSIGRFFLKLSIEISRPVFVDGSEGFYQLSTILKINDHYIRISPVILVEIMDILADKREQILEAVKHVRDENEKIRESRRETEEKAQARTGPRKYQRTKNNGHNEEDYED